MSGVKVGRLEASAALRGLAQRGGRATPREAALACGMLRVDTMRAALALLGRAGLARRCGGGAWESTAGEDVVRDAFGLVSGEGPLGRLLDAGAAR